MEGMNLKKSELGTLRTKIAEQTATSRAIRTAITAASGRERYDLWEQKRHVGAETRRLLLAYAYLRGKPYRAGEPTTLFPTDPAARRLVLESLSLRLAGIVTDCGFGSAAEAHARTHGATCAAPVYAVAEHIRQWLQVPEADAQRARREAAMVAGVEAARQARSGRARRVLQAGAA